MVASRSHLNPATDGPLIAQINAGIGVVTEEVDKGEEKKRLTCEIPHHDDNMDTVNESGKFDTSMEALLGLQPGTITDTCKALGDIDETDGLWGDDDQQQLRGEISLEEIASSSDGLAAGSKALVGC